MFLTKREMYSDFSFIEINICKGSGSSDSRIDPHTEFTYYNISFKLYYIVVYFSEFDREVVTRENLTSLDDKLEWCAMLYRKIFSRKRFDHTPTIHQ
jgi:hypothetical protein